jgi:DNA-binding transcriptional ArsR family regulator
MAALARGRMTSLMRDNIRQAEDIRALGRMVHDLSDHIALLAQRVAAPPPPAPAQPRGELGPDWLVLAARAEVQARRFREKLLPHELFLDPAWDMLLDLFVAHHLGQRVNISNACLAADIPLTTALRWLSKLEQHGLVVREDDPNDRRRAFVRLTPPAESAIAQWLIARQPQPPQATGPEDQIGERLAGKI